MIWGDVVVSGAPAKLADQLLCTNRELSSIPEHIITRPG
jgi:hypothetical protein